MLATRCLRGRLAPYIGCRSKLGHRNLPNRRWLSAEPEGEQRLVVSRPEDIRNLAIIAHVDHGKTTMVDKLLRSCSENLVTERLMDSMALEQERGITIMSKCTRLDYGKYTLNVVDTPGHADFGGEVERVLSMVSGVLLVVDATEGPMSQTKFVLGKALAAGLKPVVVINKVDRDTARMGGDVDNEIFDLFVNLGATDEQLEYPTLYASGRMGWATPHLDQALFWSGNPPEGLKMGGLLDTVVEHIPAPCQPETLDDPFALAINNVGVDTFLGPMATGRIESGSVEIGRLCRFLTRDGAAKGEPARVTQIFVTRGTTREPLGGAAGAGDIVTVCGIGGAVGDTITTVDAGVDSPLNTPPMAPPTLAMTFGANDGPLQGEGDKLTASSIKARLVKETENNVTIMVQPCPTDTDKVDVFGRGEMQFGILIEGMRREGYEFIVSPPRILTSTDENGNKMEPIEEVTIDVDAEYSGLMIDKLTSNRKGALIDMRESGRGKSRLIFNVPSRGMLGLAPEARNDTHGSAIVNSTFSHMTEWCGLIGGLSPGKLVATDKGKATAYALFALQERGKLFVEPGQEVYSGMVVGENSRSGDLEVNPCKAKKVTNVRSTGAEEKLTCSPPHRLTVEEMIAYMGEDEMIEVTPKSIRLRKSSLDQNARARLAKLKRPQKN